MIGKELLIEFAKLNNHKPWQQEKHYIQALVLTALSEYQLVFKGGTYLWFFHGLNRFSEDLDFTANGELPKDLGEKVSQALKLFGVKNSLKTVSDDDRSLSFRISARGPLNSSEKDVCHVYVEISRREAILEKTVPLKTSFDAYQLPTKIIEGMGVNETTAEKIRAVITRKKARDVFDLHFLAENKKAVFNEQMANKKLEYYNLKFSKELFLSKTSEKKEDWERELEQLVFGQLGKYSEAEKTLKHWIEK